MFRRFVSHPYAIGLALLATLMVLATLERMSGTEGAYHMLARVGTEVSQQVVVVGHRVVQQVVIVGRKLSSDK
ncbi:hypothetical protein [Aquabacterium sp.]|uniref:hypothetical protein n=1 Tax=Aquabacterium sp. TaxID=1872578 RepID=UPI002B97CC51|nr:hypothetical protein [Aquabacterium sp.]HSW05967.1 hypothetical protein [Aquabacterium sp.]